MMRLSVAALVAALVTSSLVACSNGYGVPQTPPLYAAAGLGRADAVTPGIYAISGGSILAYPANDGSNGPPVCSVGPFGGQVGDIAVDRKGDLFVPGGTSGNTITVFAGPGLCGPKVASIADPYGNPVVAAADPNPGSEKIVVGTDDTTFSSSVSVCTLSDGCTSNLTNPNISNVAGVAIARNGDCWGVGLGRYPSTQPSLVYFAHCQGHGVLASGFQNQFGGKVDIDDNGNLISLSSPGGAISDSYSLLYIYSGCNPACTLVRRPFPLFGVSDSFHLDGRSKRFVAADIQYNQLDVYSYSTNSIEYKYSINNGLSPGGFVAGAAFSPESKE